MIQTCIASAPHMRRCDAVQHCQTLTQWGMGADAGKQEPLHACSMSANPPQASQPLKMQEPGNKAGQPSSPTGVAARDDSAMQVSGFQAVTVWHPVQAQPQHQQSKSWSPPAAGRTSQADCQQASRAHDVAGSGTPQSPPTVNHMSQRVPQGVQRISQARSAAGCAGRGAERGAAQLSACLTAAKPDLHPSFSAATRQLLQAHHQLVAPNLHGSGQQSCHISQAVGQAGQGLRRAARAGLNQGSPSTSHRNAVQGLTPQEAAGQQPFQFLRRTSLRRSVHGAPLPAASPAAGCSVSTMQAAFPRPAESGTAAPAGPVLQSSPHSPAGSEEAVSAGSVPIMQPPLCSQIGWDEGTTVGVGPELTGLSSGSSAPPGGGYTEAEASFPGKHEHAWPRCLMAVSSLAPFLNGCVKLPHAGLPCRIRW